MSLEMLFKWWFQNSNILSFIKQGLYFFALFLYFFSFENNIVYSKSQEIEILGQTSEIKVFYFYHKSPNNNLNNISTVLENILFDTINKNNKILKICSYNDHNFCRDSFDDVNLDNNIFQEYDLLKDYLKTHNLPFLISIKISDSDNFLTNFQFNIEYEVINIKNNQSLFTFNIKSDIKSLRQNTYIIANDILDQIAAYNPLFHSKLLYVGKYPNREEESLHIIDRNGYGEKKIKTFNNIHTPIVIRDNVYYANKNEFGSNIKYINLKDLEEKTLINDFSFAPSIVYSDLKKILYIKLIDNVSFIETIDTETLKISTLFSENRDIILSPNLFYNGNLLYNKIYNGRKEIFFNIHEDSFFKKLLYNKRIGDGQKKYFQPLLSPNEKYVLFNTYKTDTTQLGILNFEDNQERIILSAYNINKCTWHKYSQEIACSVQYKPSDLYSIFILDINGNIINKIEKDYNILEPFWFE